jgi:hypothetical protein
LATWESTSRPEAGGVAAAANAVAPAGLMAEKIAQDTAVADLFYGFEQHMAKFDVRRDDQAVRMRSYGSTALSRSAWPRARLWLVRGRAPISAAGRGWWDRRATAGS